MCRKPRRAFPDIADGSLRRAKMSSPARSVWQWDRRSFPDFSSASWEAVAAACCSGVWKKIADRYCVPTSGPWRFTWWGRARSRKRSAGRRRKPVRVEVHFHRFGMAGPAGAHLFIGRVRRGTTFVAYRRRLYPGESAGKPPRRPKSIPPRTLPFAFPWLFVPNPLKIHELLCYCT